MIKDVTELNPKIPSREAISKLMDVQFLPMKLVEAIYNKIHLTEIRKYGDVSKGSYSAFIDGDVIFAKVTPCMENGKIAIVNNLKNGIGFGSSEFHVIRSCDKLASGYIFYLLVQDRFRHEAANAMTGAVGLRRVPKQFIENYEIPLPPIIEQLTIIQEIESRLSVTDKMEETITQSLQQAEALRQSILKKAFEGKLVTVKEPAKVIPIERKALACHIINLNHSHRYFGLTKFQKALYLCEQFAEVEYETHYEQERAGPYDRAFTTLFKQEMSEEDWFRTETKVSLTHFLPGANAGKLSMEYVKHFRAKGQKIRFVLELLKEKTLFEAELIATIYAVWNNVIIKRLAVDIDLIMEDVYNWSTEKMKYTKDDIVKMFNWMKLVGLVPNGFGKEIKKAIN